MSENDGPAQSILKEKLDNQNNSNTRPSNLEGVTKEEEQHSTHSFEWSWNNKPSSLTCSKAGTVVDSLNRSAQFRNIAEKNNAKELVIMKDGRAICSHFPCRLIGKDERLTVKYVKAVDPSKKLIRLVSCKKKTLCELVIFHVLAKGGKNVTNIIRNPALKAEILEVTVYAYKGERVKNVLKRDGRFNDVVFKRNCVLFQRSTEVKTELSNLVDDLDGKTFQIKLLNKSSPPDSQPSSLEDAYILPNESHCDSENGNTLINEQGLNSNMTPDGVLREIPGSKKMQGHLSLEFKESVKGIKVRAHKLSRIQNLLRVEFGQNAQMCREVKTMKKLMDLSSSVCQVRINGSPAGSGFLLFGRYVFTNGHVIRNVYNDNRRQLDEKVSVHFSYESVEQTGTGLDVEEVVCFEYCPDVPVGDLALLKISDDQTLPFGLLKHLGLPPQEGGICIIGHPGGGVKKIDPCLIIPSQNRQQVVERHCSEKTHIQLVSHSFFEEVAGSVQQKDLTYESCFYFGSSGSPVFDKYCNVVAVHTGGYVYPGARGENRSVIEYGHPLPAILERLIIQLVERKRFDVLKEYLACSYPGHHLILDGVKKLMESRNLTKCKEGIGSLKDTDDLSLQKFWGVLSQKEEPVPMDIN